MSRAAAEKALAPRPLRRQPAAVPLPWTRDHLGYVVTRDGRPWLGSPPHHRGSGDCIVCGEEREPGTLLCLDCRRIETRGRALLRLIRIRRRRETRKRLLGLMRESIPVWHVQRDGQRAFCGAYLDGQTATVPVDGLPAARHCQKRGCVAARERWSEAHRADPERTTANGDLEKPE